MTSNYKNFVIRKAKQSEYEEIGKLIVNTYSKIEGFQNIYEHPDIYLTLKNIGFITENNDNELLVAVSYEGIIAGVLVYSTKFIEYENTEDKSNQKYTGYRLLAVSESFRNSGIGKSLINDCIRRVKTSNRNLFIKSGKFSLMTNIINKQFGFKRFNDTDFLEKDQLEMGIKLTLKEAKTKIGEAKFNIGDNS